MGIALLAVVWLGLGCVGVRDPGGIVTGRAVGTGPQQAARVVDLEPRTRAKATESEPPARHQLSALPGTGLAIVRAGQTLRLENDTPVFHRIFSRAELNAFELGSLESGSSVSLPVLEPGENHLRCSLHSSEGTVRASAPIRVRRDASLAIDLPLQRVSAGSD